MTATEAPIMSDQLSTMHAAQPRSTGDLHVRLAAARDTFLTRKEVFDRYRWGRSRGYEITGGPGFPRPIGGQYRLDTLIAWEEALLAAPAPERAPKGSRKVGRPRKVTATLGPDSAPMGDLTLVPSETRLTLDGVGPRGRRATTKAKGSAS